VVQGGIASRKLIAVIILRIFGCQNMHDGRSQEFSCEPNFGGGGVPPAAPWLHH